MLNFNPESGVESLRSNQRSVAAHIDDDYYVRRFTPGMFLPDNGAVATFLTESAAQPRWPTINMPDAVSGQATVTWERPSHWLSGKLRTRYWYTSDTGSTNNFVIRIVIYTVRNGQLLNASTLGDTSTAVPGPAVALTAIRSDYIYTTTSFDPSAELFSLRIQRTGGDASDTNVNDFSLLYVRVQHIPATREANV